MLFVNEIGEIVHGIVDKYSGAANKNIGDAFLLVWKFEEADQITDPETGELHVKECGRVSQLADMSVLSFVLLIAALTKNRKMIKYNDHVGLNERMPGYAVKLGLGLHLGYSIEGPIGSYYKIDASYLSPHVNMAMRLEGATKAFGVPLLIHQALHRHLTRKTRDYCRIIDCVVMAGNDNPVKLYTVDVDREQLDYEKEQPKLSAKERKIQKIQNRIQRDNMRTAAYKHQIEMSSTFESNKDIQKMRTPFTKEFLKSYNDGFKKYMKGQWSEAKPFFDTA